jgi:hypothetical protein
VRTAISTTAPAPAGVLRTLRQLLSACREPMLGFWALYVFLFPVYVFGNGLPQPGDLLIFVMAPVALVSLPPRLSRAGVKPTRALLWFTAYVVLVDFAWAVLLDAYSLDAKVSPIFTPIFYLYNVFFFVIALALYDRYRERFLWVTLQTVLLTVVVQVAISIVYSRGGGTRGSVMFNNPNQLGYYATLTACILTLGRRAFGLSTFRATVGLLCCGYLGILSASKAALGSIAILVAIGMLNRPRTMILAALGAVALLSFGPVSDRLKLAQQRIQEDESAGFYEERGYDRIMAYPEYWVLGSGEGAYRRFREVSVIGAHELHSSAGTLFFCYGIVGLLLFARFVFQIVRFVSLRTTLVLVPAAAYGLTHQGLRFTLFWILLALALCFQQSTTPAPRPR